MIEEKFLQELLERVDIVDVVNRHFPLKMAKYSIDGFRMLIQNES